MSELNIKAIEELLDIKLDEKFDQKLKPIHDILNSHTDSLERLV